MKISSMNGNVGFDDKGMLVLVSYTVSLNAGTYPNAVNANVTVTPDDGASLTTTRDDLAKLATEKVKSIINSADSTTA